MFFAGSKKLKISLILLTFAGFVFSLSCAFSHRSEASTHASISESIATFVHSNEACCGTSISTSGHLLKENFLALSKNQARNWYDLLAMGLILVSAIFGRRFFEHIEQRLAYVVRLYYMTRQYLEFFAFHYLRLAFSRGILSPKKYHLVFSR